MSGCEYCAHDLHEDCEEGMETDELGPLMAAVDALRWLCPTCSKPLTVGGTDRDGMKWACYARVSESFSVENTQHYRDSIRHGSGPNESLIALFDRLFALLQGRDAEYKRGRLDGAVALVERLKANGHWEPEWWIDDAAMAEPEFAEQVCAALAEKG